MSAGRKGSFDFADWSHGSCAWVEGKPEKTRTPTKNITPILEVITIFVRARVLKILLEEMKNQRRTMYAIPLELKWPERDMSSTRYKCFFSFLSYTNLFGLRRFFLFFKLWKWTICRRCFGVRILGMRVEDSGECWPLVFSFHWRYFKMISVDGFLSPSWT